MQVRELGLAGLKLVFPRVYRDPRGYFLESYQNSRYEEHGISCNFIQDNHAYSKRGTLRGLHFQSSPGQAKLISVGQGKIFDVAVDIRVGSPTFGKWEAVILDSESHAQLFIPVGFAHGYLVLSEEAHVFYKVDSNYESSTETGFRWDDPDIKVQWPVDNEEISLSERDREAPYFCELFGMQHFGDS